MAARSDHFLFGSVFIKKKPNRIKKNQTQPKPVQNDRFWFGSVFRTKIGSNQFDSNFLVWLGFFPVWLGLFPVWVRFGSVFLVLGLENQN
jgi:hypothetical protein